MEGDPDNPDSSGGDQNKKENKQPESPESSAESGGTDKTDHTVIANEGGTMSDTNDPEQTLGKLCKSKASLGGHVTKAHNAFKDAVNAGNTDLIFASSDQFFEAFQNFHLSHTNYIEFCAENKFQTAMDSATKYLEGLMVKHRHVVEITDKLSQQVMENTQNTPESAEIASERDKTLAQDNLKSHDSASNVTSHVTQKSRKSRSSRKSGSSYRSTMSSALAKASAHKKSIEAEANHLENIEQLVDEEIDLERQQIKDKRDIERRRNKAEIDAKLAAARAYEDELKRYSGIGPVRSELSKLPKMTTQSLLSRSVKVKTEPGQVERPKTERDTGHSHVKSEVARKLRFPAEPLKNPVLKKCKFCSTSLDIDAKFCTECGQKCENKSKIKNISCACGFPLSHTDKHCPDCGQPLEYIDIPTEHVDANHKKSAQRKIESNECASAVSFDSTSQAVIDMMTVSQTDIPKFSGSFKEYYQFIAYFDSAIDDTCTSDAFKLSKLLKACEGEALELVEHCRIMKPKNAYKYARKKLDDRYGNKDRVVKDWISKVKDGPPIKSGDSKSLLKFSDELLACTATLQSICRLYEVNSTSNIEAVAERLPYQMKINWMERATKITDKQDREPSFKDFAMFVKEKARVLSNPRYESLLTPRKMAKTLTVQCADQSSNNQVGSSNTSRSQVLSTQVKESNATSPAPKPPFCFKCRGDHYINHCTEFTKMSPDERLRFVRESNLCWNCYGTRHNAKNCKKHSFCKHGCETKHSDLLHDALVKPKNHNMEQSSQNQAQP